MYVLHIFCSFAYAHIFKTNFSVACFYTNVSAWSWWLCGQMIAKLNRQWNSRWNLLSLNLIKRAINRHSSSMCEVQCLLVALKLLKWTANWFMSIHSSIRNLLFNRDVLPDTNSTVELSYHVNYTNNNSYPITADNDKQQTLETSLLLIGVTAWTLATANDGVCCWTNGSAVRM